MEVANLQATEKTDTVNADSKLPILLLAAGASVRMGRPKQLLPWGESTIIEHQIKMLQQAGRNINVVLGAYTKQILPVIEKYETGIFINKDWKTGMGSSVSFGVSQTIKKFPEAEGILIAVVDQPLLTSYYFAEMIQTFQNERGQIIASQYKSGEYGVPVIFGKQYFKSLIELKGEEGARKLIELNKQAVKTVHSSIVLDDLDTYEMYVQKHNQFRSKLEGEV